MKFSRFLVPAMWMAIGAILAILLFLILRELHIRFQNPPPPTKDSPVTVRGGSIELADPVGQLFAGSAAGEWYEKSNVNNSSIYLYGVQPDPSTPAPPWGTTPQPVPNPRGYNWKLTVWDRDQNAHPARNAAIQICSAQPSSPQNCDEPSGTIDGSVKQFDTWFTVSNALCKDPADISAEGSREVFTLHDATDDGGDCTKKSSHKRDHIGYIQVTLATSTTGQPASAIYDCINGQCTISIGAPEP